MQYTYSIKFGLKIIAYGDKSEKALKQKFSRKGFSEKAQELSVALFKKNKYIDDNSQCEELVIKLCNEKHFGVRRIKEELYKKGYNSKAIEAAISDTEADFDCAAKEAFSVLSSKCDFSDQKQKSRLFSAMMRMGHDAETIKGLMHIEE